MEAADGNQWTMPGVTLAHAVHSETDGKTIFRERGSAATRRDRCIYRTPRTVDGARSFRADRSCPKVCAWWSDPGSTDLGPAAEAVLSVGSGSSGPVISISKLPGPCPGPTEMNVLRHSRRGPAHRSGAGACQYRRSLQCSPMPLFSTPSMKTLVPPAALVRTDRSQIALEELCG